MPTPEIDRARTEALAVELLRAVGATLATPPLGKDNVFVALNALAFALCPVLAGSTGPDAAALEFFRRALADNLVLFAAEHRIDCTVPDWLAEALGEGGDPR
jgi:hypothetical protein